MDTVDVAMVVGANDMVNPSAREDERSPIYGMPIIDADKARTCFILKRSMASASQISTTRQPAPGLPSQRPSGTI